MADRELRLTHRIGDAGRFRLVARGGTVRIEGIDGDDVEVTARYRTPSGMTLTDDPEADGVVHIVRESGGLGIETRDPGGSGIMAGLTRRVGGTWLPDVDYDVRVPRTARMALQVISADGELRGLRGDQEIRTLSGDIRVHDAAGRLAVTTVSGDVAVAGDVLWITATTTSGDIVVEAELVQGLAARSVSGDVVVRAALGRDVVHSFEAISGDLQLATPNGVTIELRGLSGSVRADGPTRREVRDGRKLVVVGDGAATLRARTVSGDVVVTSVHAAGGRRTDAPGPSGLAGEMAAFGRDMAAFGAGFAKDLTAGVTGAVSGWPSAAAPPSPPGAPVPGAAPVPPPAPTTPTASSAAAADQLEILRRLEAGEIDVEEAARRLEGLA